MAYSGGVAPSPTSGAQRRVQITMPKVKVTQGRPPAHPAPTHGAAPVRGRGPSVRTPAVQNYLAPLSTQQITQQATKTVSSAYKPAYTALNQQSNQAKAISDKRSADNRYYLNWIDQQQATLQAHADAANQQLIQATQQADAQQQALYSQQPGSLIAQANARAGNVSNNAQSNAFNQQLVGNEQANEGLQLGAAGQLFSNTAAGGNALAATRANSAAFVQAGEAKNRSDLQTTLQKIGDAITQTKQKQTGDVQKEISRLQGIEISKAEYNQNYATAAEKLGISVANTKSEIAARQAAATTAATNAQTSQGRLTLAQQTALNRQMNSDRNFQLAKDKYGLSVAKDQYQREHGLGPYKPSKSGVKPPLTQTSQNTLYRRIDTITGKINQLISVNHLTPEQAYHYLQHGGYVQGPPTSTSKATSIHIAPVGDGAQILNAAFNLRQGGSGLSPGDVAALKAMGLATPGKHYPSYNNQISPGAAASRT